MTTPAAPSPLYRGPVAHYDPGNNGTPVRVILHSTVSPCAPGQAEAICTYFRNPASGGSAHYVTDPGTERQAVWDADEAWHAPGAAWSDTDHPEPENIHSLGIEMTDTPGPVPGDTPGSARWKAAKRGWRWTQPNQRAMLRRTALLTAGLCVAYDIPVRFLSVADLHAGKYGISTHANVSAAFHRTDHWDPGFWPQAWFMRMTRKYADRIRAGETWDTIRATL